jgi:hypothetical protein
MLAQFGKVLGGWVAFMLRETIFGIEAVVFEHRAVALDLRNHARGGNAQAQTVTADQSRLWAGKIRNWQTIDEHMARARIEFFPSPAHSGVRGPEDVQAVDFLGGNVHYRPTDGGILRDF